MAFRFYRNNRIVPPFIGLVTIFLLWCLIDPTANRPRPLVDQLESNQNSAAHSEPAGAVAPTKPQDASTLSQHGSSSDGPKRPLRNDEVLLIVKTGATVLWRRLPIHIATTLSPDRIAPDNVALYSDVDASIGNWTIVDILKQSPQSLRDSSSLDLYKALHEWDETNHYHIGPTRVPGDDGEEEEEEKERAPDEWRLDKYMFLPLIQHAGQNWPSVKWYLYTEDDTYMFLPNVLLYLASYDHTESHWLGRHEQKLGATFAHGGSGFALSRGAWERSFGKGRDVVKRYRKVVDETCCGDYALGKVLNDYGVRLGEDPPANAGGSGGFNGWPHWETEFSLENWCLPVLTWHRASTRDIARYYALEESWDFSKPLNYGDFYASMIAPALRSRRGWWHNLSSRYTITSTSSSAVTASRPNALSGAEIWDNAWKSADSCEAACQGWSACVQWYHDGDACKMDDRVFLGHAWPDGMRYRKDKLESVSGWLTDRVDAWKCR